MELERSRREQENTDGTNKILVSRDAAPVESDGSGKVGRPEMNDDERTSDPDAAQRGKQPKPSNEGGSMGDDGM